MPTEPAKAQLFCLDMDDRSIDVSFNPTTFKFNRKVKWTEGQEQGVPYAGLTFDYGQNDTLSVSFLLDKTVGDGSSNEESVLDEILAYYNLTMPVDPGSGRGRPPVVAFLWEAFQFQGVVTGVDVEMLLFDANGRPKRAMVSLSIMGRALSDVSSAEDFFSQQFSPPSISPGSSSSDGDDRVEYLEFDWTEKTAGEADGELASGTGSLGNENESYDVDPVFSDPSYADNG